MSLTLLFSILTAARGLSPRLPAWRAALSRAWHRWTLSEHNAYLARATDLVDLERRQRSWEQRMEQRHDLRRSLYL